MEENEKENTDLEKKENLNENQQPQNSKQKNKSTLIIIVLLVIIAGLLVFIGYDKVFKKDTDSNKKADDKQQEENKDNKDDKDDDNQKEEKPKDAIYNLPDGEISITNEDLIKYHNVFKTTNYQAEAYLERLSKGTIETLSKDDVNTDKIGFAITKIKPVKRSCSLINLNLDDDYFCGDSTSEMLIAHSKNDKEKVKMLESKNETNTFTKEEIDSKEKEIFGEILDVPKDNIVGYGYGFAYIYDPISNLIAEHSIQAGGTAPSVYEETITSASKNGDLLTIESRQLISWGENSNETHPPKISKVTLTLKWNEEVGRYVFYSRESIEQK